MEIFLSDSKALKFLKGTTIRESSFGAAILAEGFPILLID